MQENEPRRLEEQPNNREQNKKDQKPKKKAKRGFALKPQHFETPKGLQKLYELTNQINWDDKMTVESAMNLVTTTLKTWQYNMVPKYSFDLFIQRCQALGSHKILNGYMMKVRRIHKGVEKWSDEIGETKKDGQNDIENQKVNEENDDFLRRVQMAHQLGKEQKIENKENMEIDEMMDQDLRLFEEMNKRRAGNQGIEDEMEGIDLGGEHEQFSYEYYDD